MNVTACKYRCHCCSDEVCKSPVTWQDAAATAVDDDDDDDNDDGGGGGGDYLDWLSSMKRDGETDKKLT